MHKKTLVFTGKLGEITIVRRIGLRRLTIRVNRKAEVSISIPYHVTLRRAEQFLMEKSNWIIQTRERIIRSWPEVRIYRVDEIIQTRFHTMKIAEATIERSKLKFIEGEASIFIPKHLNIDHIDIQDRIRKGIIETYRREAHGYLLPRLKELAIQHDFKFGGVRVKNMKSRWGSCSSRNNINLNLHLIRLPDQFIDYVLIHELVHTVHKNHGTEFWKTLEKHCPGARQLSKQMKKYSILPIMENLDLLFDRKLSGKPEELQNN